MEQLSNKIFEIHSDETASLVLNCKINDVIVNSLLDSGAGKSLMDIETAEKLNIVDTICETEDQLFDASGNIMDIVGTVKTKVEIVNSEKAIMLVFRVLNKRTLSTILLGRDCMKKLGEITFDISRNTIKLNNRVIKGRDVKIVKARLTGSTEIPGRTECLISARGISNLGLLEAEFEPRKVTGISGVYFSKVTVSMAYSSYQQLMLIQKKLI